MSTLEKQQIVVTATADADLPEAQRWSSQLKLPLVSAEAVNAYSWALICDADKLRLRFPGAAKPFSVDFTQPAYMRRLQQATCAREPLARAVGLKPGSRLHVLDGTTGWGSDTMVLAKLGAQVTALERSPIVAALLANGIQRAQQLPLFANIAIELQVGDTQDFLAKMPQAYDAIYLDPMFPERPNSALVKKPLQLLQTLLGEDPSDVDQLVAAAFNSGCKRVVIKRPTWAEPLFKTPSFSIPAGVVRFDGYLL
jgi:16S rRNA (guanine1516-N2)-methyltransferase